MDETITPHRKIARGKFPRRQPIVMTLALLIPLTLTFYAWNISSENITAKQRAEFEALAVENEHDLLHRLDSYEHALLGGVAFYQSAPSIKRADWKHYAETIDLAHNFPGVRGIGVIDVVKPETILQYGQILREENGFDVSIHPQTQGKPYYIIRHIEPEESNKKAIGLNIAFEEHRQEAAELSRITGQPAITRKIALVQDAEKAPGFLLLYPLYRKDTPTHTKQERIAALQGWIYVPFIAGDFLRELTKSQGLLFNLQSRVAGLGGALRRSHRPHRRLQDGHSPQTQPQRQGALQIHRARVCG